MFTVKATLTNPPRRPKWHQIYGKARHDMVRLGEAGYRVLKSNIPVSKLSKPHLRDSFKVKTYLQPGGILLRISTTVPYAAYLDLGANVPIRFPRIRKAMKFVGKGGQVVFAKKVRGFQTRPKYFMLKTGAWMTRNIGRFVDLTLQRYL